MLAIIQDTIAIKDLIVLLILEIQLMLFLVAIKLILCIRFILDEKLYEMIKVIFYSIIHIYIFLYIKFI